MTWSLLAHEPETGTFAVAVTTCALAVGASCPFVRRGVGAVSTQSITNRYLGPAVLDAMARGLSPSAAIEGALVGDDGKHMRQVHAIDSHGRSAAWTGNNCVEWCGSRSGSGWSVAGNMLAGPEVVSDTAASFIARQDLALPERMLNALQAGETLGGDKRGRQSAALKLITNEDFPDIDLRVDDHGAPLDELERLLKVWRISRAPMLRLSPRRSHPSGSTDLDAIEAGWQRQGLDIKFRR
ncbi:DUF1028 domain-containing protein [Roseococcus pinisoli]|uniref:DUF1028 domain-containing protein n=1 Tax=Roseococcus pinisoli TaxID=2835040 RepID=A0ABS5QDD1_9PROT|nr:DUF1028 domain-containing protein [Roseococcus pinisoli]MBS7811532.1 DUF1028 domain-containing protein [Roseococcus pinisoli]